MKAKEIRELTPDQLDDELGKLRPTSGREGDNSDSKATRAGEIVERNREPVAVVGRDSQIRRGPSREARYSRRGCLRLRRPFREAAMT